MKKLSIFTTAALASLLVSGPLLAQDSPEQTSQEQVQAAQGQQQTPQRKRLKDGSCQAGTEACTQNRQGNRSIKGKRSGPGDGTGKVERPRDGSGFAKGANRCGGGRVQGNHRGSRGSGRYRN